MLLLALLLGVTTPFATVRTPTHGPAKSIGGYSAGCIEGAVALPMRGAGFKVVHPERKRVYGHPLLIGLIRDVGKQLKKLHLAPLGVGDLAQPRGGPAPSGHASHQTGLDVDLFFGARERLARLLELVASDPRVDRVFVNPAIKRELCESIKRGAGAPRPAEQSSSGPHPPLTRGEWLHKVRPWWGHDEHFHVRLACPPDSPDCVAQPPVPAGDGCEALEWWFSDAAKSDRDQSQQQYGARVGAAPQLPERCTELAK
jgi:penicillin-insensitive murein DD-endopeptidase